MKTKSDSDSLLARSQHPLESIPFAKYSLKPRHLNGILVGMVVT